MGSIRRAFPPPSKSEGQYATASSGARFLSVCALALLAPVALIAMETPM